MEFPQTPGQGAAPIARGSLSSPPRAHAARRVLPKSRSGLARALFLFAAGVSFLFSVYLWFLVDREQGLFVGLWVPSILALGALSLSGRASAS